MGQKITFRVFKINTGKDVTDRDDWYIDAYGDLYMVTDDIDMPLIPANGYRYEATLVNNQS